MTYQIKVKTIEPFGKEIEFTYNAVTHPNKGDILYYRDIVLKVVEVGHVIRTHMMGQYENNTISFVELMVNYA